MKKRIISVNISEITVKKLEAWRKKKNYDRSLAIEMAILFWVNELEKEALMSRLENAALRIEENTNH